MMLLSSIPNILSVPDVVDLVIKHLGYPMYFLPMIGVAKLGWYDRDLDSRLSENKRVRLCRTHL